MRIPGIFLMFVILVNGCTHVAKQRLTVENMKELAADYVRKSEKCAPILKKCPDILIDLGDPDFNVIARNQHSTTREDTAYQLPVVEKTRHGFIITFWHNGLAYDSTSYFINVYLTPDGDLIRIDIKEKPGGSW